MQDPIPPVMSGGLSDVTATNQAEEPPETVSASDHVSLSTNQVVSEDDGVYEEQEIAEGATSAPKPITKDAVDGPENKNNPEKEDIGSSSLRILKEKKQRKQSFFIVPDVDNGNGIEKGPQRIEMNPLRRSSTFQIGKTKERPHKQLDRSSLEAIMPHAMDGFANSLPEIHNPLPGSRNGSTSEVSVEISSTNEPRSSLEMILQYGAWPKISSLSPTVFPLPGSPSRPEPEALASDGEQQQSRTEAPQAPALELPPLPLSMHIPLSLRKLNWGREYMYNSRDGMKGYLEGFEHLENGKYLSQSRHNKMNITMIDFLETGFSTPLAINSEQGDGPLAKMLSTFTSGTKQRLLLVEDTSARTIGFLGTLYGINPEFFEEHLINSGYTGPKYNDPPAQTWKTSELKKSYVSLKWHRPVWRLDTVPHSNRDLEDLLDPDFGQVEYTSDSNRLVIYQTETNVFRSEWGLWTDPTTTSHTKRVCGWEERVSIWRRHLRQINCRIVILLLDPLPTLMEGFQRIITAARPVISENENSAPLDSAAAVNGSPSNEIELTIEDDLERIAQHLKGRHIRGKPPTRFDRYLRRLWEKARQPKDAPAQLSRESQIVTTLEFQKKRSREIFQQMASRTYVDVDLEAAFRTPNYMQKLKFQLNDITSTRECFKQWLASSGNSGDGPIGVMTPLFHIIRKDTEGILKILRRNLEDMNKDILDDARMEDRLTLWRQLISRAQFELPELKRSMDSFFSFFEERDATATEAYNNLIKNHQIVALEEYQDLSKQIDDVLQKLQIASASLISNMGLLESKRSIAEAQSVTKLTELAFFFIPLTFAASIFGMQIEQFETRAPLSTFIILGLAFTAFSYLVRLLIRSMWIRRLNEACAESIKFYADRKRVPLQRGSVPASLFVQWMGSEIKGIIRYFFRRCWYWIKTTTAAVIRAIPTSILIILIIAVGPIAVLWTRDIDHGIQAIITAILLVSIIVLVGILPKLRIDPKKVLQTIDSKDLKKRIRQCPSTHRTFFNIALWTCLIAIAVVPLTLVWVRPVAPGIKAAITAMVVLGVMLGFISYGLYKLISAARMAYVDSSLDSSSSAND